MWYNIYMRVGSIALCFVFLLAGVVEARNIAVPPMPVSAYADTEVTTNISFNVANREVTDFAFNFSLQTSSSNSVQVAFGRDNDNDDVLSIDETDVIYGCRNGRYFIEKVSDGERYEKSQSSHSSASRSFSVFMHLNRDLELSGFSFSAAGAEVFPEISAEKPDWLCNLQWNLMRVTRRGAYTPGEWFGCNISLKGYYIIVR